MKLTKNEVLVTDENMGLCLYMLLFSIETFLTNYDDTNRKL